MEINPSIGHGYKIMTVDEWAYRWKRNDDFPECMACGSTNTKEHHFIQVRIGKHLFSTTTPTNIHTITINDNSDK